MFSGGHRDGPLDMGYAVLLGSHFKSINMYIYFLRNEELPALQVYPVILDEESFVKGRMGKQFDTC